MAEPKTKPGRSSRYIPGLSGIDQKVPAGLFRKSVAHVRKNWLTR